MERVEATCPSCFGTNVWVTPGADPHRRCQCEDCNREFKLSESAGNVQPITGKPPGPTTSPRAA